MRFIAKHPTTGNWVKLDVPRDVHDVVKLAESAEKRGYKTFGIYGANGKPLAERAFPGKLRIFAATA